MLKVKTDGHSIKIGERFSVDFQRTLRIPDDGRIYPLPPGLGHFPIFHVEDYQAEVPSSWVDHGGVFIPMYQREALWLNFNAAFWKPNAVKIGIGKINAVSGKLWSQDLKKDEKDYVVCPHQPWLDGINAGDDFIKQFVAMPLGMGYTVEAQITCEEKFGGIQIIVYEPKPGKFPDKPPVIERMRHSLAEESVCLAAGVSEMGLGAGGRMRQKIYPDPHGIDTWDRDNFGRVYIHIVNSLAFRDITGLEPPPTPISAKLYSAHGLPWFDLYDKGEKDLKPSKTLKKIKTIKEIDKDKGFTPQQDDDSLEVPDGQVVKLKPKEKGVSEGKW